MDLSSALTSNADEKSTPLNHIQISDIRIPHDGAPIADRKMRLRRLDVFPGGTIGLHDHANRPAILYVLRGSMTVYDDQSDAPIVVAEGKSVHEVGLKHYAVNNSDKAPRPRAVDLRSPRRPNPRRCQVHRVLRRADGGSPVLSRSGRRHIV